MSILINSLKRTGGISPELMLGITVLKSLINDFNRSMFSSNRICFCFLAIYLEEISNQKDLLKEVTRMRIFIADKGSTVDIAKLESAQIEAEIYRGKFGNEYNTEEYGKARFDTKTLDIDTAKKVFENYSAGFN